MSAAWKVFAELSPTPPANIWQTTKYLRLSSRDVAAISSSSSLRILRTYIHARTEEQDSRRWLKKPVPDSAESSWALSGQRCLIPEGSWGQRWVTLFYITSIYFFYIIFFLFDNLKVNTVVTVLRHTRICKIKCWS